MGCTRQAKELWSSQETFVCRCVEEYINDTKLDHVPDILSGLSVDDKIHQSYHEVVMSDSDIDKLVSLSWPLKMSGVVYLAELDLTFLRHLHLWCFFTARVLNCVLKYHNLENMQT